VANSEKLAESRRKEAGKAMIWTAVESENWRRTVSDPEKRNPRRADGQPVQPDLVLR
jgi:hypothetical protein